MGKNNNKNDKAIVAKISGINNKQANKIATEIKKIKQKHAPKAKGTIITGNKKNVLAGPKQGKKRLD
jgi:Holliday junction resolvasome RuvABC DNA-binding subunit